nr:IS5 family transposase [Glycomyces xiaoerkulensis]
MSRVPAHAKLTHDQWEHLRKWIPAQTRTGRPITRSRRVLLDGIAWRVRTGSPWRFVPEATFGPWQTVYWLFRTWQMEGLWPMLLKTVLTFLDAAGRLTWYVSVDSTIVRVHQHAAGAAARPVADEPDDHAIGSSRGGRTTKLHTAADNAQVSLSMSMTAGQAADSPQFRPLLERIRVARPGPTPDPTAHGHGRQGLHLPKEPRLPAPTRHPSGDPREEGPAAQQAGQGPRRRPTPKFDREAYNDRNTVERFFNRLKRFRAVGTRYDKYAVRYEATVQVAMILDWKP